MSAVVQAIRKVATGPQLSKDLTLEESRLALQEILQGKVDPARAAVFFIAMRMKRETHAENLGMLHALQDFTETVTVDLPDVLLLTEPFNGFTQHCPVSAFLPVVLAACGIPTVSQGVQQMGPKFGVTHAQVLAACGIDVQASVKVAAAQLTRADIGWAYLDQSQTSPAIYALQNLRTQMIKRPSLTTLEKLTMPVQAQRTHLMTGYVHKAYPEIIGQLAAAFGYQTAVIVRGVEGGVTPTLREQAGHFVQHAGQSLQHAQLNPADLAIRQSVRGVLPPEKTVTAAITAEAGLAALQGKSGAAFDSLVLGASIALWQLGCAKDAIEAATQVRTALQSGQAYQRFQRAIP